MKNEIFNQSRKYSGDIKRNIVMITQVKQAFRKICDDDEDVMIIETLSSHARDSLAFESNKNDFIYTAAIGYPFNTMPFMQTRFSDGTYPVWYGSETLQTSVCETVHHVLRFLHAETGVMQEEKIVKMRSVFDVFCDAIFIDLTGKSRLFPAINADDYAPCNQIGSQIRESGLPGLIYSSLRDEGGVNFGVFNPSVLSRPEMLGNLKYVILPKQKIVRVTGMKMNMEIPF